MFSLTNQSKITGLVEKLELVLTASQALGADWPQASRGHLAFALAPTMASE
jgi:hypothetical protein